MNPPISAETLRDLIARHAPGLILYARQLDPFSAEDVVQDAFVRLVEAETPPENVKNWLFRVVRNGSISARRSGMTRRKYERRIGEGRTAWFESDDASRLDAAQAAVVLEKLPGELREVVVARIWGELTFEEIGELTETSRSSAHRRYLEGLARIRERLETPCPGEKNKKSEESEKSEIIN